MKRILISGGAGFIGSHFVEHLLKHTDWEIVILDRLNYASTGFDRLRDIKVFDGDRVKVFTADFTKPIVEGLAQELGQFDYIVHMGAETHVDNSISDPEPFVMANVVGTMRMLDFARLQSNLTQFVYFSTDEVFGPAGPEAKFPEWARYNSGNPYAAAKAGGEELALAYANTYRLPVLITHTMNVFGERQHPEKFIPGTIKKILKGETVMIHSNPAKTQAGSRFYIHARNVAAALMFLLDRYSMKDPVSVVPHGMYWRPNKYADKFNIVGEQEVDNSQMMMFIYNTLKDISDAGGGVIKIDGKEIFMPKLRYEMVDFHSSRPGHDLRYALDGKKLREMGWSLPMNFEQSLKKTVEWTIANPRWLQL